MAILVVTIANIAMLASTMTAKLIPLYIWNVSESVPRGLYRVQSLVSPFVTELVVIRPPQPLASFLADGGYLPPGVPLLKRVLALPGQTVCRNGADITVDQIVMGIARERDGRGRVLPVWQGCRVIATDELFVMNWQSENSLDGRYFGPIAASAVIARAFPVWTEGED